jgi:hypothetical protein
MHATLAPPGQQEMCPWYDLVDRAPDARFAMPDALDVIRACQRVIVWRRQTLIDETGKHHGILSFAPGLRVVLRLRISSATHSPAS